MKTGIVKQEILIVIAAFHQKEYCKKNAAESLHNQSPAAQLEEACWNGLLDELLNGILERPAPGKRLCLWQIHNGKSVLKIELCDYPQVLEKHLSIDPYIFLPILIQN